MTCQVLFLLDLVVDFIEDTSLTFDGNQQPAGRSYFQTASTIPIDDWLDATDGGQGPGSNQPACWAIASGGKAGTPNTTQNFLLFTQYTVYFNFCDSGCSLSNLRCYCLLGDQVTYDLGQDYFGFEGTKYGNWYSFLSVVVTHLLVGAVLHGIQLAIHQ